MAELADAIAAASYRYGLDQVLVAAVVLAESGLDQYAYRYEPGFFARYLKNKSEKDLGGDWPIDKNSKALERIQRSASYGYMQIMGQVARELHFNGAFQDLFDARTNLMLGCRKLSLCKMAALKTHPEATTHTIQTMMLLKYNGGADPKYPLKVIRHMEDGTAARLLTPT